APGWADGAQAERFIALPGEARIGYSSSRGWNLTNGTALVQTLTLEGHARDPASRTRIETRVLLRQENEWVGYSYRWNEEQSDAFLFAKQGENIELIQSDPISTQRKDTWRIPSRSECLACHSRAVNFLL